MPDARFQAAVGVALQAHAAVSLAASASEALEVATAEGPDVVVIDVSIADMHCIHLIRALLARRRKCVLLVLAADPEATGLREASRLPLDGFFLTSGSLHPLLQRLFDLSGAPHPISRVVATVIAHVARHSGSPNVCEVARAARISPNQLLRRFRLELGLSVKDYIARVQTTVAQRLLWESDVKLQEVAELTGFCDASHLSRVFVRHIGVRPGAYRRRHHWRAAL